MAVGNYLNVLMPGMTLNVIIPGVTEWHHARGKCLNGIMSESGYLNDIIPEIIIKMASCEGMAI